MHFFSRLFHRKCHSRPFASIAPRADELAAQLWSFVCCVFHLSGHFSWHTISSRKKAFCKKQISMAVLHVHISPALYDPIHMLLHVSKRQGGYPPASWSAGVKICSWASVGLWCYRIPIALLIDPRHRNTDIMRLFAITMYRSFATKCAPFSGFAETKLLMNNTAFALFR